MYFFNRHGMIHVFIASRLLVSCRLYNTSLSIFPSMLEGQRKLRGRERERNSESVYEIVGSNIVPTNFV